MAKIKKPKGVLAQIRKKLRSITDATIVTSNLSISLFFESMIWRITYATVVVLAIVLLFILLVQLGITTYNPHSTEPSSRATIVVPISTVSLAHDSFGAAFLSVSLQLPDLQLLSQADRETQSAGAGYVIYRSPKDRELNWIPERLSRTQVFTLGREIGISANWNIRYSNVLATVSYGTNPTADRITLLKSHPCSALLVALSVQPEGWTTLDHFIISDPTSTGSCLING